MNEYRQRMALLVSKHWRFDGTVTAHGCTVVASRKKRYEFEVFRPGDANKAFVAAIEQAEQVQEVGLRPAGIVGGKLVVEEYVKE